MVMLFMQQGRIIFYIFNRQFFPNTSIFSLPALMFGGVVFDLTAMLYINSLFIVLQLLPFRFTVNALYQRVCKWIFIVTNSVAIATNMADVIYYRFTFRRSSALVIDEFANEKNYGSLFFQFAIDYWYMFIITGMVITGLIVTYKLVSARPLKIKRPILYYPSALVVFALAIPLFIGGVRGGFAHSTRPITISNATQYVTHLGEENIVLNTPFSIIRTFGERPLERANFFGEQELDSIYSPLHNPIDTTTTMQKKNVVVIIVESLGSEYIGKYNQNKNIEDYQGYTPFLDSLLDYSIYFTESHASGKKSIDGMASVLASIPSLIRPYILTPYSHNYIKSLPKILRDEGYQTSFFHGAPNGSMGMLAYSNKLEIEHYYGKSEYDHWKKGNDDFDGIWGIWDKKFMEFFSDKINEFKEPFFTSIFTLSSHHPFKVPKEDEGKYKSGGLDMHPVIGYTDDALREFFNRAKTQEWYKNTVFIITGDHTNQSKYPFYNTTNGSFRVPVILFDPQSNNNGAREMIASQMDIFPTVLNYLGYNKPFFSFGTNLLGKSSADKNNFAIHYTNSAYNIFYKNYLLIYSGKETLALYDMNEDPMQIIDVKSTKPDIVYAIERKIKAFIQQFNNRMLDNKLQIK